jgi:hypothetical protein
MRSLLVCMMVLGCGGESDPVIEGSGLDPALALGTLDDAGIAALCEYGASLPPRSVMCNGQTVSTNVMEQQCIDLVTSFLDTCAATVEDMEICMEDLTTQPEAEVCGLTTPPSCSFFGDADCVDV